MFNRWIQLLCLFSLCSCQVYRNDFDCPPCKGVPCTSVSDIQNMIVETPEGGPDLFVEKPIKPCRSSSDKGGERKQKPKPENYRKRIWVDQSNYNGACVEGHFIYFSEEDSGECCFD